MDVVSRSPCLLSLTARSWWAAVTPIGGAPYVAAWLALAWSILHSGGTSAG